MSMLDHPDIRENLAELFSYYYDEVHYISDIAATESQGIRPAGLENELYACMHHIARGLAVCDSPEDAMKEINKGKSSHLKRLHFDAFKIAINSFLTEYGNLISSIRFIVLEDSFKGIDPDGTKKAVAISDLAAEIKRTYLVARKQESSGEHDAAKESFGKALTDCYDLREKILELTQNNLYQIALSVESQKERNRKREKRHALYCQILIAVLTAVLTAMAMALATSYAH